ncbi:membrane protein [Amycolatopsis endophytica]|uniref:Heparin binding hemagglutinin HbhA n=1 Tax=Amycolatopsis endophytica TaxID=860233 RepID=A0A853AZ37_9PSEU|nr:hypothetical protein [Amycolatopsis endophytica]NYI88053.1 heparin binding hemagglutinin HbhA [Amycolatopsis endophytica]
MPNTKTAIDQLRTPLLAALGAGNLAGQAVVDAVGKARERVVEGSEAARKNIEELPTEVTTLREKLDPAELRKAIDDYTEAALKLYNKLAETGEQAWDKFLAEPRVKSVVEQVEEALVSAQGRVGEVSTEARERVEEVLGLVAKRTRTGGEKVAEAADEVADRIEDEVKSEVKDEQAKPAAKTTATKTPATRRSTTPAKRPANATTPKTTK